MILLNEVNVIVITRHPLLPIEFGATTPFLSHSETSSPHYGIAFTVNMRPEFVHIQKQVRPGQINYPLDENRRPIVWTTAEEEWSWALAEAEPAA